MKSLMLGLVASVVLLSGCASTSENTQEKTSCSVSKEEPTVGSRIPHRTNCGGQASANQT